MKKCLNKIIALILMCLCWSLVFVLTGCSKQTGIKINFYVNDEIVMVSYLKNNALRTPENPISSENCLVFDDWYYKDNIEIKFDLSQVDYNQSEINVLAKFKYEHNYQENIIDATCTEIGLKQFICSVCQDSYEEQIEAKGHSYDQCEVTKRTCIEKSRQIFDCTECNEHIDKELDDISAEIKVIENITSSPGFEYITPQSKLINYNKLEVKPSGGFGSYSIKIKFLSQNDSENNMSVFVSDYSYDYTFDPYLDRISDGFFSVSATTPIEIVINDEYGNSATYVYSTVDKEISSYKIKKEHRESEEVIAKQPTCTDIGLRQTICFDCQEIISQETLQIVSCQAGDWIIDKEPSCNENGVKYTECIYCKNEMSNEIILGGHIYEDCDVSEKTCKENAKISYRCERCKQNIIEDVDDIIVEVDFIGSGIVANPNGVGMVNMAMLQAIASGGYGKYLYKFEVFVSQTSNTASLIIDYSSENRIEFTSSDSINDCVVKVFIKDEYENESYARYYLYNNQIIESAVIDVEHKYDGEGICSVCEDSIYSEGLTYMLNADQQSYSVIGLGICTDEEIYIPKEYKNLPVTRIENKCFYDENILGVIIPNTVISIGTEAFYSCSYLEKIELPETLLVIEDKAFADCESLEQIVLPDSINQLGNFIFSSCYNLKTVNIPTSIDTIPHGMFSHCVRLKTITIPENIISIDGYAFFNTALEYVFISKNIKIIESSAFESAELLQVDFEDCENWKAGDIVILKSNLEDQEVAAALLSKIYSGYSWQKQDTN